MSLAMQSDFAAALSDGAAAMPPGLAAWHGLAPERRFAVYRNNVGVGLTGALASRFPVTERLVGEAFFAAMARSFIAAHPPRCPVLLGYGDDFADFVAAFEPAATLAYLPDIVRLEVARSHAYHAADAAPLDVAILAALDEARLADLVFALHPSLSVVRSSHPIVDIWAMNADAAPLAEIADWHGQDALVLRPHMTVLVQKLPPGGAVFLAALAAGQTLGTAIEAALDEAADFDITANLVGVLQAGALTALR